MSDELATSTSSPVVAHDDAGQPIIEDDLVWESYCRPVAGEKLSLLPPADFEGDDDDWETHRLIESVKKHRRRQQGKENGNG
jgi:hypothetical protein